MASRIPIFAANWKMNKLRSDVVAFCPAFSQALGRTLTAVGTRCEVILAPVAVYLSDLVAAAKGSSFQVAAQNCGTAKSGAFTGEISPQMLKEIDCPWVIIGHSERRHVFKEDATLVQSRLQAALAEGLKVIYCVGEQLSERKGGRTWEVVEGQLGALRDLVGVTPANVVVAYEPVWAIGTGETATPEQAQEVHKMIRLWLHKQSPTLGDQCRILYGGSAKADNASQLMSQPDVDGLLVGGASLDPNTFALLVKHGLESAV